MSHFYPLVYRKEALLDTRFWSGFRHNRILRATLTIVPFNRLGNISRALSFVQRIHQVDRLIDHRMAFPTLPTPPSSLTLGPTDSPLSLQDTFSVPLLAVARQVRILVIDMFRLAVKLFVTAVIGTRKERNLSA